jgi:solute carrier family 29 (equilibrative nucleoside transporter), member 1/2/3
MTSLLINIFTFILLALSTTFFRDVSPGVYLGFLLTMVFLASLATGLSQNGVFAYVSGFDVEEYTQAIMTGQAIAGVLPPIARTS